MKHQFPRFLLVNNFLIIATFWGLFLSLSVFGQTSTLCSGSVLNLNCGAGSCPSPYPEVATVTTVLGRDNNYSVFIGGNLTITGGAEMEGKGFVYGDFNFNPPSGNPNYNTGYVGVGTGVVPDANTDWLTIGGNLNFNGLYLLAGGTAYSSGQGNVRIKGSYNSGDFYNNNGNPIADPSLNLAPFDACFSAVNTQSQCWKAAPTSANATYSDAWGAFNFGSTNGASGLYVYNVTTNMDAGYAGGIDFSNIPTTATILINVDKPGSNDNIVLNIGSFTYNGSPTIPNALKQQIIWNFPDAATVAINGGSQFIGAIVIPNRASTLNINSAGTNGRIIVGGNVNQIAGGSEFHNYSFEGNLSSITCESNFPAAYTCTDATVLIGDLLPAGGGQTVAFPFGSGSGSPSMCGGELAYGGEGISYCETTNKIYITNPSTNYIVVWDATLNVAVDSFDIVFGSPYDAALSTDCNYLYVATTAGVVQFDLSTNTIANTRSDADIIALPGTGTGDVWGVDVNPSNGDVYVTFGFLSWDPSYGGVKQGSIVKMAPDLQGTISLVVPNETQGIFFGLKFMPNGNFWTVWDEDDGSPESIRLYSATGVLLNDIPMVIGGTPITAADPNDIAFGPDGNIYVTTYDLYCAIRYVVATGTWEEYLALDPSGATGKNIEFVCANVICNVCSTPTNITLSQTAPTCSGANAQNNGKITLTAITNADKFGVSTGATYSGTPAYAAATAIGTLPQDLQTAIPNAGGTYTIRFFNGADACFKDTTVTIAPVTCNIADLALTKTVNNSSPTQGSNVIYSIKVKNEGTSTATGVIVHDTLPVGMTFVSALPSGVYDANTKLWTIGNIAAGDSTTLAITVRMDSVGVLFNTAEVHFSNEPDTDSTPNNSLNEDDQDQVCVSVPVPLCTTQAKTLTLTTPSGFTNIKWHKNGVEIVGQNTNTLLVNAVGSYTFSAEEATCPVSGCCPIIVEEGGCACPTPICLPVIVQKF